MSRYYFIRAAERAATIIRNSYRERVCTCGTHSKFGCGRDIAGELFTGALSYHPAEYAGKRAEFCRDCLSAAFARGIANPGRPPLEGVPNNQQRDYLVEISHWGTPHDNPDIAGNLMRCGFTPYRLHGACAGTTWRRYSPNLKFTNVFDTLELLGYNGTVTVHIGRYDGATPNPSCNLLHTVKDTHNLQVCKLVGNEVKIKQRFTNKDALLAAIKTAKEKLTNL